MEKTKTPGVYRITTKGGDTRYRAFTRVNGRQETKTVRTLAEARSWKAEKENAKAQGTATQGSKGRMLYAAWVTQVWLPTRGVRSTSEARDLSYLKNHVLPVFGGTRLQDLERPAVQAWLRDLERKGLAAATIRKLLNLLRLSLQEAVDARYIGWNPADGLKGPQVKGNAREGRFLRQAEVEALASAIGPNYRALVLLLGFRGLRIGEALALHVEDLHLDADRPYLEVTKTLTPKGEETPPKTASSVRKVPLPPVVVKALRAHLGGRETGYVWETRSGGPTSAPNVRRSLKRAAAEVGLEGVHLHDLRHTAASLLVAKKLRPEQVQAVLGHSRASTTMDLYVKTQGEDVAEALQDLPGEEGEERHLKAL